MSFQFTEILKVPLSNELSDKFTLLEIQRGTRVAKRAKYSSASSSTQQPFSWHVAELRLYVNNKKSCGITMTANEFDWLTSFAKQAPGGKVLNIFTDDSRNKNPQTFHCSILKFKYSDSEYLVSTISEQGRVFSILLSQEEIDVMTKYRDQLLYILKASENNKGPKLYTLVEKLFYSYMTDQSEMRLRAYCEICLNQGGHGSHAFMLDTEDGDPNKTLTNLVDTILEDVKSENEFIAQLNQFFEIMCVDKEEKDYVLDKLFVDLKANKEAIKSAVNRQLRQAPEQDDSIGNLLAFVALHKVIA